MNLIFASVFLLFFISKTENDNQVHYAINLNNDCKPFSSKPVFAYWEMKEQGTGKFEALLPREEPYYGLGSQKISDHIVETYVRSLPKHPIQVRFWKQTDNTCHTEVITPINNQWTQLQSIHLVQSFLNLGVKELVLYGNYHNQFVREVIFP